MNLLALFSFDIFRFQTIDTTYGTQQEKKGGHLQARPPLASKAKPTWTPRPYAPWGDVFIGP